MENKNDDIRAIREMMEKSSKFLSLHGLAGVFTGIIAIIGASFAWFYLLKNPASTDFSRREEALILLANAVVMLVLSVGASVLMACRKARRNGQPLMNKVTWRALYAMAVPLAAGGVFCLICRCDIHNVISATLIFYGLALVSASRYTCGEIHWLGLTEIVLGLLATYFVHHVLVFWVGGFGVCHIVYGLLMYLKYDRRKDGRHYIETE